MRIDVELETMMPQERNPSLKERMPVLWVQEELQLGIHNEVLEESL
jgi:hypothetical protein